MPPLDRGIRIIERIEGVIHDRAKRQSGQLRDEGIAYRPRRAGEEPKKIHITGHDKITGLDQFVLA